ncbi:unnamed protein product [Pocillopora meandrina]|uniref:EGF-like domain-containing protein n=1 Tax=Pocillopora meandrina TaxID=46732 RepID=A0AAU9XS95_9CNID|nr:unnamed protein product [Pocillopora meandrina]
MQRPKGHEVLAFFRNVSPDQCRILAFPSTLFFVGERLINHTIVNISVIDRDTCEYRCYLHYNCVSVNFYFGQNGAEAHNCELNNSTGKEHERDLVKATSYVYHGTNNFCAQSPCKNTGTCQSDADECQLGSFTCHAQANCVNDVGSYHCTCQAGYVGDGKHLCTGVLAFYGASSVLCSQLECNVDECRMGTYYCHEFAQCVNVIGSYDCVCQPGYTGDGEQSCTGRFAS